MTDAAVVDEEQIVKKSKKPLLVGTILGLLLGGGGFYAVASGLILATEGHDALDAEPVEQLGLMPDIAFIPIKPLIINIGPSGANRFLRFQAQLEVKRSAEKEVTALLPRIVDVLNGYLRAVETAQLEERTALIRMRAQMLRRVQVVTGKGRIRDLLIMEFVLN